MLEPATAACRTLALAAFAGLLLASCDTAPLPPPPDLSEDPMMFEDPPLEPPPGGWEGWVDSYVPEMEAPLCTEASPEEGTPEEPVISSVIETHGLSEGDEMEFAITALPEGAMPGDEWETHFYLYKVIDGHLTPMNGGPPFPTTVTTTGANMTPDGPLVGQLGDSVAVEVTGGPSQGSEIQVEGDLQTIGEVLQSLPEEQATVRTVEIDTFVRVDSAEFMQDLIDHGIEVEFHPAPPNPRGAIEYIELLLDGQTRASIEQFDDPEALSVWHEASRQIMTDLGLDPDEHVVRRGMTIIRIGPRGHSWAKERFLEVKTMPTEWDDRE